jgi:tRNA(fMet)-specific endonuclease VapC
MSILLLDTDVVSFLLKGDSRSQKYAPILQGNQLALSFMTVAELFQWAAVRNWGTSRTASLERSLTNYLIIPVDIEICRTWGNLRAERQAIGIHRIYFPSISNIPKTMPAFDNLPNGFKSIIRAIADLPK